MISSPCVLVRKPFNHSTFKAFRHRVRHSWIILTSAFYYSNATTKAHLPSSERTVPNRRRLTGGFMTKCSSHMSFRKLHRWVTSPIRYRRGYSAKMVFGWIHMSRQRIMLEFERTNGCGKILGTNSITSRKNCLNIVLKTSLSQMFHPQKSVCRTSRAGFFDSIKPKSNSIGGFTKSTSTSAQSPVYTTCSSPSSVLPSAHSFNSAVTSAG